MPEDEPEYRTRNISVPDRANSSDGQMVRKRVRELEAENAQFKRMCADLTLENTAMRKGIAKKAVTP